MKEIFTSKHGHFDIYLDKHRWGLSLNYDIDDLDYIYQARAGYHIIEIRLLLLNITIRF